MSKLRNKPFLTIEEQVNLLESRNVVVLNRQEAEEFLLKESYYSVINGYKDAFLNLEKTNQGGEDYYKDGVLFNSFIVLFTFDKALRKTTLQYLTEAESIMKTSSVYAFCYYHREKEAYLDPASYCSSQNYAQKKNYTRNLIKLLGILQHAHDNKGKDYIKHYLEEYDYVPLWVVSNLLTFGNMAAFFDLQQENVQNAICQNIRRSSRKDIEDLGVKELRKAYRILPSFRNICAHNERLYCARVGKTNSYSFNEMFDILERILPEESISKFGNEVASYLEIIGRDNDLYPAIVKGMNISEGKFEKYK